MLRTINSVFFSLALCFGLLSCEKEYSAEGGGATGGGSTSGTAVFTLDGAPGACTTPTLQGTYTAGTAMDATNTVLLVVNVTTPGTYTITTSSANGVRFTGTGTFTAVGLDIVSLSAAGTPVAAGTFNYTTGTTGCSFPVTFTAATGGGGGGSGSGTAVFTYDGAPTNCTTPIINGTYTAGTALTAANTVVVKVNVTTPGTYTVTTGAANGVTFSGSGTLASGAQTITLTSTNTPTSAGTINYTPGTNGCVFSITYGGTTSAAFLRATLSGTATDFNTSLTGSLDNTAGGPSDFSVDGSISSATGSDNLTVDFTNLTGLVTTGNYANASISNTNKYVIISYTDNAGTIWIPNPLTANAATANLTTLTANSATGTFSGTLNPLSATGGVGTATKVITNGSFSVTF